MSGTSPPIRVVVADDEEPLRASFRLLIDAEEDMAVVGEAADGAAVVRIVAETRPDVVLMDVRMPGVDGIEATRRLRERADGPRVLVLTMFDADAHVDGALRAGASGFLLKNVPPAELVRAVRLVHAGHALLSPEVTARVMRLATGEGRDPTPPDPRSDRLTRRERMTLELIARGRSNQEIAAQLFVTHATVRTYVSRLLAKTGSRDRAQLVVLAYDWGVVHR
ncbi:response regulator [Clavibacter michiganensis]|uniref:response regulator n=1 Tax=Clavibacter michiganensis TaxID=28447 RepID=UPI003EBB270D